ncbi:uncharacterized protein LOC135494340 [Lineus longissimus]|uniref:uncharacterized protein LOC135494340 n=1 Tax=Lineus longissimus TaxID=88925 RepID=UPI00315D6678
MVTSREGPSKGSAKKKRNRENRYKKKQQQNIESCPTVDVQVRSPVHLESTASHELGDSESVELPVQREEQGNHQHLEPSTHLETRHLQNEVPQISSPVGPKLELKYKRKTREMLEDTSKQEMVYRINRLESYTHNLEEQLNIKRRKYKDLYKQYNELMFTSAVKDEHYKGYIHHKMLSQVSSYSAKQVFESIFSKCHYDPNPDIDNVIVPFLNLDRLGKLLKEGRTTKLYEAHHGGNTFCAKVYPDEGGNFFVYREFQILACLNVTYAPHPIAMYCASRKPSLVTSFHYTSHKCLNVEELLSSNSRYELAGIAWLQIAVGLGKHLSDLFDKCFLHNNIQAENIIVSDTSGNIDIFLCSWSRACGKNYARLLTERQISGYGIILAPEVARREKPFTNASEIYAYGTLCQRIVNFCENHEIQHPALRKLDSFSMRCMNLRAAARPDHMEFHDELESFNV